MSAPEMWPAQREAVEFALARPAAMLDMEMGTGKTSVAIEVIKRREVARRRGWRVSDYEPASGWNLPPGCFENDPRAPWNEPDPWVGHACGECRHCRECAMLDGSKAYVCTIDRLEEVDPTRQAEECFEPWHA